MIELARRLLKKYVFDFQGLYGERYMSCNLHQLLHLADNVKKFGPLWVTTCLPFENLNGVLKSYIHGSKNPELQACSSVTTFLTLSELKEKFIGPESDVLKFCKKVERSATHRHKLKLIYDDMFIVGAHAKVDVLPINTTNLLINNNILFDENKCHVFRSFLKNGVYFETESYAQKKKTNSSIVLY